MAGFRAKFGLQGRNEGAKEIKNQGIRTMQYFGCLRVNQGGNDHRPMTIPLPGSIDLGDTSRGFGIRINKWHTHFGQGNAFKLREQAMPQGFGSDACAIGDEKDRVTVGRQGRSR
jgi:hypothetical protein